MQFDAAVLHRVGRPLAIERVTLGPLRPHDVLVRVRASSVCHTDVEVAEGQLAYPLPIVLGHEAAGTVERTGSAVSRVVTGDHVVLSWNPNCGNCFYCDLDQPILCEQYLRHGPRGTQFDGDARLSLDGRPLHHLMFIASFAEYCVVSEHGAVPVPVELPFDRACLLGCGVMTGVGGVLNIAHPPYGATVAVLGCGAVGLSAVQGARLAGAERIVALDIRADKLELARRLGATHTFAVGTEPLVEAIKALTQGRGADVVIEAAGTAESLRLSVELTRPGGQVVWLGKVAVGQDVPFRWGALMGEKRITRSSYGGARPARDFPMLARAYLDGRLKLDELISRRIALADINAAFAALKRGEVIRTVIEFPV
ncbi:MAG: Zn-dependent alcohol dehydrogenase [Alphaproteobacteria bacterium]|nr:Zn-dependent alcohol dehydrogenase [Alphaproteobacteria bacterium]